MSVMVLVVAALAGLAKAVQLGCDYSEGHGTATQHARVVLERIARTVHEATASEQFPGFHVVAEYEGMWRFPDTLVVWHPSGTAADPDGLPRYNELIIFCPDPEDPARLLEITLPSDVRVVPPVSDGAAWEAELAAIKTNMRSQGVTLTRLVRVCSLPEAGVGNRRGAVRFEPRLRPSDTQWSQYKAGTIAWEDLDWAQSLYGPQAGLRQAWLRTEIQLMPGSEVAADDPGGQQAIPYFGSAALYYELNP